MTDETVVEPTSLADILSKGRELAEAKTETPEKEAPEKEAPKEEVKADDDKAKETKDEKPEGEDKEKSEKMRDEKGRFVPKEEADNLRKAMKDERRQRQELERKLSESQKPKEKTDFWADPDKAVEERLAKERAEYDQRFFRISERYAKRSHEDYDEVVSALLEDAEADPDIARTLFPQVSSHDDPAEFLYQQARNHRELKSFEGDLGKYREHVESPLKKDLEASKKRIEELESQLKNLGKIKPSLNDEQSTAGKKVSEEAANEPTPMTEILDHKKRRKR